MEAHHVRFWILVVVLTTVGAARTEATQNSHPAGSSDAPGTTSAIGARYPIFTIDRIAVSPADPQVVGREVAIDGVEVSKVAGHRFWVSANGGKDQVLVVPAEGSLISVREGESVNIHGDVRLVRIESHRNKAGNLESARMDACVYAYTVRPAW